MRERYGHVLHFAGRVHAHHRRDRCQRNVHGSTLCGERLRHGEQFADPHRPVSRFLDSSRQQQHQPRVRVATDNFGNTFVTGTTSGSGFPTTPGAYETAPALDGSQSAFVAKFDASGNLVWSTLIDGARSFAIAVDGSDNVYVTGEAYAADFQTTSSGLSDHGQCERKRLRCRAQSNRLQCHLGNLPRRKRLGVRRRDRPRQGRQRVCRRRHGGDRFSAQKPDSAAEQWR